MSQYNMKRSSGGNFQRVRNNNSRSSGGIANQSQTKLLDSITHKSRIRSCLDSPNEGNSQELLVNFFRLTLDPATTFYHYDLSVKLCNPGNLRNVDGFIRYRMPKIIAKYSEFYNNYLIENEYFHDGNKNIYSINEMDLEKTENDAYLAIELVEPNKRTNTFEVSMKFVRKVSSYPFEEFYSNNRGEISIDLKTIYQVFINFNMNKLFERQIKSSDNYFFDPANRNRLQNNVVETIKTYECLFSLTEFDPSLNIAVHTTTLAVGNLSLLDFLKGLGMRVDRNEKMNRFKLDKISSVVKGFRVYTTHSNMVRSYVAKKIIEIFPSQMQLDWIGKDGTNHPRSNVAEYFRIHHKINLLNFPLIETTKGAHIPLELLKLEENQFFGNEKASTLLKSQIVKASQIVPSSYFEECQLIAKKLAAQLECMPKFEVKLDTKLVKLESRFLKWPKTRVDYAKISNANVALILISSDTTPPTMSIDEISSGLTTTAGKEGLKMKIVTSRQLVIPRKNQIERTFDEILKERNIDLAIFGLSDNLDGYYVELKRLFHSAYGIATQMFLISKMSDERKREGIKRNLLIKMKGKIGIQTQMVDSSRINNLAFNRNKTMVLGLDVIHSSDMLDRVKCSVAALVGSYDPDFYRYATSVRVQARLNRETVDSIGEMFREVLMMYRESNNYYPESIILFRDGVSKEQMRDAVLEIEMKEMNRMFSKLTGKKMKITVIVVPKRHSTRLMLSSNSANVPAGTSVFTSIVEPKKKMFYLNAHFSRLGTSRPIKLYVVHDDHNLRSDVLFKFCLYACYNCVRASDVISVPVPIAYADLLAYHAKLLLVGHLKNNELENVEGENIYAQLNNMLRINKSLKKRFFFS